MTTHKKPLNLDAATHTAEEVSKITATLRLVLFPAKGLHLPTIIAMIGDQFATEETKEK